MNTGSDESGHVGKRLVGPGSVGPTVRPREQGRASEPFYWPPGWCLGLPVGTAVRKGIDPGLESILLVEWE